MGITASGLGSGLDINSLVSQLVSSESKPLSLLKTQEKTVNAKISAYGQLTSALSTLQNSLKGLSATGLSACSASSSATGITASAGSGAVPSNYAVVVTQLAQTHKLISPGQASATASLGAGTLSIAVAGGAPVVLSPATNSLNDIRDAINASGLAVTASIISDGSANGQRLVISGKDSGAANAITLAGTGALASFSYDPAAPVSFGYDGSGNAPAVMSQTQAAQDAQLTIDGVKVTLATNTISGAIGGITLKLTQAGNTPVTITVDRDAAAAKNAVNAFVKAWNDLKSLVGTQTAWNETTKTGAVLHGDSSPTSVISQLRSTMSKTVAGAGSLSILSDLGISFQKDGSLSVSESKLQSAIDKHPSDVVALFAGSDGIVARTGTLLTNMLGDGGLVNARKSGLNASLRDLGRRETSEQARLDAIERRYRAQFTRLDAALSRMQNTSTYLSQQLASIAKSS